MYWGLNLLFTFLSQIFKTLRNSNFQNDFHFKMLGAHFHPTLVQVCMNPRMFFHWVVSIFWVLKGYIKWVQNQLFIKHNVKNNKLHNL
jgi:hypothetical protein